MRRAQAFSALLACAVLLAGCGGAPTGSGSLPSNPTPPAPSPTPQLYISTGTIPPAKIGTAYSAQLTAANGTGALTWTSTGLLPQGMSLSPSGVLSGTPASSACAASFGVKVTDSSSPAQSATTSLTFNASGLVQNGLQGQVGVYFQGGASLQCGAEPVSWKLLSGSIPGLQMAPDKATDAQLDFPGSPTQAGTFNVTIQAQDANFQYQTNLTFTISPAALILSDGLMQLGVVGTPFDHTVAVTGGTPPYSFSIAYGALPAGLQLNASTGEITGTPQSAGLAQFGVKLTDSTNSGFFTINKPDSILITPAALPSRNDTLANATPVTPGTYYASLSPYTNAAGYASPDQD